MAQENKSLRDAMGAEVVDSTHTTYLVQYEDGDVESVSRDSLHGAICELSEIDLSTDIHARGRALDYDSFDGDGIDVTLNVDINTMTGEITVGGRADNVQITESQLGQALLAVESEATNDDSSQQIDQQSISARRQSQSNQFDQSNVTLSNTTASNLYSIYEKTLESRCRKEVIDQFGEHMPQVEIGDNGWTIEGTYLVTYDAENYLVDDVDIYSVSGSDVVETDGQKQAVGLRFDTEPYGQFEINGSEYTLSEKEQRFLATVEFLTNPKKYLDIDSFETEVYSAIREAKGDSLQRGPFEKLATSARVGHFIDPKSGLLHRHDIDKHVLRSTFHVNHWVIDELEYSSFDHAGLANLAWRENELRNADRQVFWDTHNDDDERWNEINRLEKKAPCPPEVYRRLRAMYGSK